MSGEATTPDELAGLAESRSRIYALLSRVYLEPPDGDLIEKMMSSSFGSSLASLASVRNIPEDMADGFEHIEKFVAELGSPPPGDIIGKLALEYTRLFRGVRRFYGPPPPYESVYLDEELVMGRSTVDVQKEYARAGVVLPERYGGEPPDHIGFELDFMRHLCGEEAAAWRRGDPGSASELLERQRRFLDEHLARWAPAFCGRLIEEAETGFYRGMAKITRGFIGFELEKLSDYIGLAKQIRR